VSTSTDESAMSGKRALLLAAGDQVAIVLESVSANDNVDVRDQGNTIRLIASESIQRFHKIALVDLLVGDPVVRDGYVIGVVTRAVHAGEWVHIHNLKSQRA